MSSEEPSAGGGASRTTDPASGSSSATDVSLREFVGMQIGYERRGVLQLVGFAFALGVFAWSQIQRRLEILNHENERVGNILKNTVSSDTYLSDETRRSDERTKLDGWRGDVDTKFTQSVTKEEVKDDVKGGRRSDADLATRIGQLLVAVLALAVTVIAVTYAVHRPDSSPVVVTVTTTTSVPG